jgi:hypothetical protein
VLQRGKSFFCLQDALEQLKDVEDNEDEKSSDEEYTAPKKRGKNLNYVIMDDDLLPSFETIEDALEYFDPKYMRDNNFTWTTIVTSSVKTIHNLKCTISTFWHVWQEFYDSCQVAKCAF